MSNKLAQLFYRMDNLASSSNEKVPDDIPCKSEILSMRQCLETNPRSKCAEGTLDLLVCKADYRVEVNEKSREQIGIAKYKEYVKDMEEKHGKDKATELLADPKEKQQAARDYRLLWRVMNGKHPKGGAPKTNEEIASWTYQDQVRLEMGEKEWKANAEVVIAEFGKDKADQLLGLTKETAMVRGAFKRFGLTEPIELTEEDHAKVKEAEEQLRASNTGLKWDGTDSAAQVRAAVKKVLPSWQSMGA